MRNEQPLHTKEAKSNRISVAACVAPDDLRCGDFVAISHQVVEVPSYLWHDGLTTRREDNVRVRWFPPTCGMPYKVEAVCLPFIFVKSPFNKCETLDVRQVQLVRLKKSYAKYVAKTLREQEQPTSGPSDAAQPD